ncbi:Uncharacterised protein [Yersinia rohdei]|nr:Uncharacterised protein [Yersinia rohdei]
MFHITAQVSDILLLFLGIANGDSAIRNRSMGDAIGVAFIIDARQQAVGHVTGELTADIAASADTDTLVFNFKIGFIFNVTEAQCAGIQLIFIRRGGRANHCAIQLSVFSHGDIKAASSGKNTGLFLYRIKVAVHFVAAGIDAGIAGH